MAPSRKFLLHFCLALLSGVLIHFSDIVVAPSNDEGNALTQVRRQLSDPKKSLASWNPDLVDPCSSWIGVTCTNQHVTSVNLPSYGLSGTLSSAIASLHYLQTLVLQGNAISGTLPSELGNLTELVTLKLQDNAFNGTIPSSLGDLVQLKTLALNNNNFSGEIPSSLGKLASTLTNLDLSNNSLSGIIPDALFQIQNYNFAGNNLNCGSNNTSPCVSLSSLPSGQGSSSNTKVIIGVSVAAVVIVLGIATLVFCCERQRRQRNQIARELFVDVPAEDDVKIEFGQLKKFSLRELQAATDDFNDKNEIGHGAFAKVYKGTLTDGTKVAVKRLMNMEPESGEGTFMQEVQMISVAVHRNLLHLIGFCTTPTERMLVYPYMPNKSVAYCLREKKKGEPELDWNKRKKIALGAARGLEYLHHHCNPKIIHRDVKAANILLNEDFEAVVGDFGLAKLVDRVNTHVTTMVRGTMGHIAPEYLSTGKSSEKTDVFGYGVMLLELVTGQRAIDFSRLHDEDEVLLLDHVKKMQHEKQLDTIVDENLKEYDVQEVEQMIQVALLCSQPTPEERPNMAEVVRMLSGEGLAERWEEWQQVEVIRRQEYDSIPHRIGEWVEDSTVNQEAIQLSSAR